MKKSIIIAVIAFAGLSVAIAQDKKNDAGSGQQQKAASRGSAEAGRATPEQIATIKTDRINRIVTLSEEQRTKVYEIFLNESKQNFNRAAERQNTKELLTGVLDATQVKKMDAAEAERQQRIQERRAQREQSAAPGKPAELK